MQPITKWGQRERPGKAMSGCLCIIFHGVMTILPIVSFASHSYPDPISLRSDHPWSLNLRHRCKSFRVDLCTHSCQANVWKHAPFMIYAHMVQSWQWAVTVQANNLSDTVNDGSRNHSGCRLRSAGFLLRCHHFLLITLVAKYEWGVQHAHVNSMSSACMLYVLNLIFSMFWCHNYN